MKKLKKEQPLTWLVFKPRTFESVSWASWCHYSKPLGKRPARIKKHSRYV